MKGKGKKFRSLSMLDNFPLSNQEVEDEESEIFKTKCKQVVDDFFDEFKNLLFEKGHYLTKMEIDSSMKAHFKSCFMCFGVVMHKDKGNDDMIKDYFNCADYYDFVSNNTNDEHWFCD